MKVRLVDATHPFLTHPATGLPLQAVGQRADGSYLWPILGADGEEGGEGEGGEAGEEGESEDDADEGSGEEEKSTSKSKKRTYSAEEYEALQAKFDQRAKHLSESDRKKSAAERELDALKRKDQSDLQNAQGDLKKVTEERDSLQARFTTLARQNAFLTASAQEGIVWADPDDAQAVGNSRFKDLEISEDGSVEGMREAVKKLVADKKYLVKVATEEDDEDKSKNNGKRGASGSGVGSTKTSKGKGNKAPDRVSLVGRFPSLGR